MAGESFGLRLYCRSIQVCDRDLQDMGWQFLKYVYHKHVTCSIRRLCVFFHVLFYVRDILYRLTCRNVCHTLQKIPYAFNQLCEHGTAVYRIFYELSCQCGRRSVLVAGCRQLYLLFWYVYVRTQYVCTILGEP